MSILEKMTTKHLKQKMEMRLQVNEIIHDDYKFTMHSSGNNFRQTR